MTQAKAALLAVVVALVFLLPAAAGTKRKVHPRPLDRPDVPPPVAPLAADLDAMVA